MKDEISIKDKFSILAVDDQELNQELITNMLGGTYNIKSVLNGKGALKVLEKFDIDLILLDIEMPDMNGFECAKLIKQNPATKDIPIIFLTSHQDKEYIIKGFKLGANDYISKPFNFEELKVRVENQLKTFELLKKLESAYKNLEKFIDSQDNIVILTDGEELLFANKKFFNYLGYDNLEQFKKYHNCICELFIENDRFFHLGKIKEDENWLNVIQTLPHTERIVSMLVNDLNPHAFSVTANHYDENTLIVTFTDISQTVLEHIRLEKKAIHDKLTDAYNREFFELNYNKLIHNFKEQGYQLGLALLDIDHFKDVNDTYGHDVGDEVLIQFVNTINKYSRNDDYLIRWGGEEFIFILKVTSFEALEKALEHLRKVIEIQEFNKVGKKTCSIGGTVYRDNEDISQTIKRADEAVYEAKAKGRNKVVLL
ncbi:diguanylate cyclase domain-containing protein [Sulfurimonas sp.]|uniref:diguanylate cyclase domain-containing protein n=1 Tax=Sulfurimonas sp. TaxID=2022749 RepID=UPI0035661FCB